MCICILFGFDAIFETYRFRAAWSFEAKFHNDTSSADIVTSRAELN